jgi:hypothetical protein
MSHFIRGQQPPLGPCHDKHWPKGCKFNPRHVGECGYRLCNFPKCEKVRHPKPAPGHKK